MPKIPQYESSQNVSRETPGQQIDSGAFAQQGRSLEALGKTLQTAAESFERVRTEQEVTSAETRANQALLKLQAEAEDDPDVWGAESRARESLQKIREQTLNDISQPAARERFAQSFEKTAAVKMYNINRSLKKKQIDVSRATLLENLEAQKETYYNAGSPQEQKFIQDQIKEKILNGVGTGLIDATAGQKLMEATDKELRVGRVYKDAELDSDFVIQELGKGSSGQYADLTPEERADLKDDIVSIKKRNLEIAELEDMSRQNEKEEEVRQSLGSLTQNEIDELEVMGEISGAFANQARRFLTSSAVINAKNDAMTFDKLNFKFNRLGITENGDSYDSKASLKKILDFRLDVMNAEASGSITKSMADKWMVMLNDLVASDVKEKAKAKLKAHRVGTGFIHNWIGRKISEDQRIEAELRLNAELMERVAGKDVSESQISEIADQVIDDFIKDVFPSANGKEIPNSVYDPKVGVVKIKDGELKEKPKANFTYKDGKLVKVDR